jgi:hypothetical protein
MDKVDGVLKKGSSPKSKHGSTTYHYARKGNVTRKTIHWMVTLSPVSNQRNGMGWCGEPPIDIKNHFLQF